MSQTASSCDLTAIELLLNGRLPAEQLRSVEMHLEACASCRTRLDELAVAATEWAEIREHLSPNPDDPASSEQAASSDERLAPLDIVKYLSPTDDPHMLGRLGVYEISGVIGAGGMGVVLKGFDRALNRFVAIKVLAPQLAANAAARRRFSREAQAAAAVVHDNVVAIHGVSEANGLPFLVMPYVRSHSLQRRLDERGLLTSVEILRIGHQIAAGLAAAHAQGLVHRDIKPANILIEEGVERLKITDFGLARAVDDASLTRTGVIAGTPLYMSPEQARGESINARSDLFSLGSVLYVLGTGRPPFRAETSYGILRRITDDEPIAICEINPDIPVWLAGIINRLLAKEPVKRFNSAAEVALLLEQCLAHLQQPRTKPLPSSVVELAKQTAGANAPSKQVRVWRWINRRGVRVALIAMLFAAGIAVLGVRHLLRPANQTEPFEKSNLTESTHGTVIGWEGAAAQIEELLRDGDRFERSMHQFWSIQPINPRSELTPNSQPNSKQETTP